MATREGHASPFLPKDTSQTSLSDRLAQNIDAYFYVTARGSTVSGEIRAGATSFLASCNNFIVNAQIMAYAGLPLQTTIVSSAFSSGIACIMSGFLSNLPLGLVTSVGPNVFLAYSLVGQQVVTVDGAITIAFMCGLMLTILSMTPVLMVVLGLVPLCVKYGLVVGTGLLTAFIGLKSVGIVVGATGQHQANIVALGNLDTLDVYIASVFLVLITSMLHRGVKGAVLIGMLGATGTYWFLSAKWPASYVQFETLTPFTLNWTILANSRPWIEAVTLLLMLLFSISGGVIGCARMAGLLQTTGAAPGQTAVYVCCGLGTMISAKLGTAPVFVSMSAAAGIREGGRTGLVSIVFGCLALLTAFFFSPLAASVPHCAIAPVLVMVGVSMAGETKEIQWANMQEALPAFLCAVFQPFTYSVTNGIYAGVPMAITLFFTTGSFIQYLPPAWKARVAACMPSLIEDEDALNARKMKSVKTMTNLNNPDSNLSAFDVEPPHETARRGSLRTALRKLQPFTKAVTAFGEIGEALGYDGESVKSRITYKLSQGGARNVESHVFGGLPGVETQLWLEGLEATKPMTRCKTSPATVCLDGNA